MSKRESVFTYYLEMTSIDQLRSKPWRDSLEVRPMLMAQFQFNRFLYQLVGEAWQWTDKLSWSDTQWKSLVDQPDHHTWVAYSQGVIAGYYELHQEDDSVEILYFGLAPQFIGQGLGGCLLSHAIEHAWQLPKVQRVWVHTCSLDHPSALKNYQGRGFVLYNTEEETTVEE